MCYTNEQEFCVILGADSSKWDKQCPIPFPSFFNEAIDKFSNAVNYLSLGQKEQSLEALRQSNFDAVGEFYIKHGKQSAYFRVTNWQKIKKENLSAKKPNSSPRNPTATLTKKIFERDFYRCRYCGLRIITSDVFSEYCRIVGTEIFSIDREENKRNGLTLGLRGVADHVEPHSLGGPTEMDNLVTSCYSCNFGKDEYQLHQLGIENPFSRRPRDDGWRGLTEFLPALKLIK